MNHSYYQLRAGRPYPLGASLTDNGVNFAIHCKAGELELVLFDDQQSSHFIPIANKTGDCFHIEVVGVAAGQHYGYRVINHPQLKTSASKLLVDPYAKRLSEPLSWHPSFDFCNPQSSLDIMVKSIVTDQADFDWQGVQPPTSPISNIYELHVKGFSQLNPLLSESLRGTYLGLAQPQSIKYLQSLGVDTIQLMPCMAFMDERHLVKLGLKNYWGYNPINFFALEERYKYKDAIREFKTLVRECHRAGIKVVLDVVFNHSAEGEHQHAVINFKALDSAQYYLQQGGDFINHTGCGNTINCQTELASGMIMDSLRYFRQEFKLDGFRFDLATVLGRDSQGFSAQAPLLKMIAQDPVLHNAILIAEPWDIGVNGYQLGNFKSPWLEINDTFRDVMRRFWLDHPCDMGSFVQALMGSMTHFGGQRSPLSSVNFISYHDGFTLNDLCSYNQKHNHNNGEQNRDGHNHNYSNNHGVEGATQSKAINDARQQSAKALFACLILARGTPHLLQGDEFANSNGGNNNAYCQDDPSNYLHWPQGKHPLQEVLQQLLDLRQKGIFLGNLPLPEDSFQQPQHKANLAWLDADGQTFTAAAWQDPKQQFIALHSEHLHMGPRLWLFYRGGQPLGINLDKLSWQHNHVEFASNDYQLNAGNKITINRGVYLLSQ
ncbi:glycogen debranching protein GlgX [Paraferrimonas sp. SM1919]|uniref:glycogen debranching protein GlgX n=1 Tax=Paraferrimonas sp. SM1919 TaxID=2662263 RepID=UPI0013D6D6E9|nr:glycogen debranching protein GlgX [Paraferrimonas sp. SM1919]